MTAASDFRIGESRLGAWALAIVLIAISLGHPFILYCLNDWNRATFNTLEVEDVALFGWLALLFVPLMLAAVGFDAASVRRGSRPNGPCAPARAINSSAAGCRTGAMINSTWSAANIRT
jgi:hypothetical protein